MRVTISGPVGSGKSTSGKILADKLGCKFFSGGFFFREKAKQMGMSLEDFGKYAEKHPEIDREIDEMNLELLRKEDNIVLESRLAGWISKRNNIPAFRVYIDAAFYIRKERVKNRGDLSGEEEIIKRENSERKRYMEFYSIDSEDTSIYDLIISSDALSAEQVADEIYARIREREK